MKPSAHRLGLLYVFTAMAASTTVRTHADASIIAAYGAARLPHFLLTWTLLLALCSAGYGALGARAARLDPALLAGAMLLGLWARVAGAARGPGAFVALAGAVALASFANLLAWNSVASTVRGRTARKLLPRAGAVGTAGGAASGLVASALASRVGPGALPFLAGALGTVALGCALALGPSTTATTVRAPPEQRTPARSLVRWLVVIALAEATAGSLADFQFKSALAAELGPRDTATFIAALYAVTNLGILVLQWTVVPAVLATRRLGGYSLVHPAIVAIAFGLGILWPGLMASLGARVSDGVLKFALSRPAQEVSLSALVPVESARWKVILRGSVTQAGAAVAGTMLIFTAPAALRAPGIVAAVGFAATLVWLLAARAAVRSYVRAVGRRLGLGRAESSTPRAAHTAGYRERLGVIVALSGGRDENAQEIARAVLRRAVRGARELLPFVHAAGPAARAVLFDLAARRPERRAAEALAVCVNAETDADALAAGFSALAAHGHAGALDRARASMKDPGAVGIAARAYLAGAGALARDEVAAALGVVLARDGVWAARIASAHVDADPGSPAALSCEVDRLLDDGNLAAQEQSVRAALALRETLSVARFERLAREHRAAFVTAVADTEPDALPRLALFARASGDATTRGAWAAGLARNECDASRAALTDLLLDRDATVREEAARALGRQVRRRGATVSVRAVEAAFEVEIESFESYLATRARPGARPAMHEAEIARRCDGSLGRVLAMASLFGRPALVHAAERRLRAGTEAERQGALNLLQEVLAGVLRTRVVSVVERWALGAGDAPRDERAEATIVSRDPWLGRLFAGEFDARADEFAVLRASPIAARARGEWVAWLARDASRMDLGPSDRIASRDRIWMVRNGDLVAHDSNGAEILVAGEWAWEATDVVAGPSGARVLVWNAAVVAEALEHDIEMRASVLRATARRARAAMDPRQDP